MEKCLQVTAQDLTFAFQFLKIKIWFKVLGKNVNLNHKKKKGGQNLTSWANELWSSRCLLCGGKNPVDSVGFYKHRSVDQCY